MYYIVIGDKGDRVFRISANVYDDLDTVRYLLRLYTVMRDRNPKLDYSMGPVYNFRILRCSEKRLLEEVPF